MTQSFALGAGRRSLHALGLTVCTGDISGHDGEEHFPEHGLAVSRRSPVLCLAGWPVSSGHIAHGVGTTHLNRSGTH